MIDTEDLVSHMRGVIAAERDLRDLGVVWRTVESSAAISCPDEVAPILPTLEATRTRFDSLRQRLVAQMVREFEAELADELAAKAQCAIDILVRNLYERTADVGFLATDEVVSVYCAGQDHEGTARTAMVARLAAYQAKYTVYDDIVLLAPDGRVLARLDDAQSLAVSQDGIVAAALSAGGYVERFQASDLGADGQPALLYAHRIAGPDGRPAGVLVLRFRFADEMQRIFRGINEDNAQLALLLVDEQQRVVATNDAAHVPDGALLAPVEGPALALTAFAGREYLAVCRASAGYQGYAGPRWRAQAMVSLLTAFRHRTQGEALGEAVPLDNEELAATNESADAINRELRRVVWNGRLMARDAGAEHTRLKAVLRHVNQNGMRTRSRVAQAIQDIHRTSLARARRQTRELARLAADILDRNLYERANDSRWWALSPVLREGLAAEAPDAAALGRVLDDIHRLYTVYSRLVVFDAQGRVCACSRADEAEPLLGRSVPPAWLQAVAGLGDTQQYAATPFEDTEFHGGGPTWTYLAAVRHPREDRRILGGIAIVFNAATELAAMLRDVLADRPGVAAFVDAEGRVLATTDAALATSLSAALQGRDAALLVLDGQHFACARMHGVGYREFQAEDGHDNGVHALVALRLGTAERRRQQLADVDLASAAPPGERHMQEMAVFQVGANRYALPAETLIAAVSLQGLVNTPQDGGPVLGVVDVPSAGETALVPAVCARRLFGVAYPARAGDGVLLAVRARGSARAAYALRVDDVLTVLDVPLSAVHPAPEGFGLFAPWVSHIVECDALRGESREPVLLQLLDSQRLAVPAGMLQTPPLAEEALPA